MKVFTLKKRKDFVKAAREFKVVTNGLVLQAAFNLSDKQQDCSFIGYTATKKLGKAHLRNKTKRRLRAAARLVFPNIGLRGINYVLIGRHNTTTLDFSYLVKKLNDAVLEINRLITEKKNANDTKDHDSSD
ncbi:MAG: ribonuclease P protein component [Alphaproteobacteria bacterium]|nr:ribonuclease P protein component [Alphaproteobacteria bacterium]